MCTVGRRAPVSHTLILVTALPPAVLFLFFGRHRGGRPAGCMRARARWLPAGRFPQRRIRKFRWKNQTFTPRAVVRFRFRGDSLPLPVRRGGDETTRGRGGIPHVRPRWIIVIIINNNSDKLRGTRSCSAFRVLSILVTERQLLFYCYRIHFTTTTPSYFNARIHHIIVDTYNTYCVM